MGKKVVIGGSASEPCAWCKEKTPHRIFAGGENHVAGEPLPKECTRCAQAVFYDDLKE